jgi:pimeloyl-ACP methyl ester carboxylesterase
MRITLFLGLIAGLMAAGAAQAAPALLKPCRVDGVPNELQCGSVQRPLDPARLDGPKIDVHFLVVPAMARNKQPDAVLMLAGGPGQSAINVAPRVISRLSRLNNRRDLVFIDQRGTGKSAPLDCPDETKLPLAEALDLPAMFRRLDQCREQLAKLPYGDLRFFTTTIAMQDMDAVREALGVPQWNLIGGSYGTRAALEYLRQFPAQVRRTVIDGVAPPDMVLPATMSPDVQAALDALFKAHAQAFPTLRADWEALLAAPPRRINVAHPLTGRMEPVTVDRSMLLRAVRSPLYGPSLAAALPAAIELAAKEGRFEALLGLSGALGGGKAIQIATGMHFSVVCAEDLPRLDAAHETPGTDFGVANADFYRQACKSWPRGEVPAGFYKIPPAPSPVLVLSGGTDPVTPPRHAERVAKALAAEQPARVQHIVTPEAGHGTMSLGCMRDVVFRFIDAKADAQALPQDAACATRIPRPPAFQPPVPASAASGSQS